MGIVRILLALAVVTSHSTPIFGLTIVGGHVAVQAFYVISGFYMSLILNEKYMNKQNSYFLFLTNRFLRLFPSYWAVLILVVFFSFFQHYISRTLIGTGEDYGVLSIYRYFFHQINIWTWIVFIFTNLFMFGQDILFFMGLNFSTGSLYFTKDISFIYPQLYNFMLISAAWTIGIELFFYVVAPFIVTKSIKFILSIMGLSLLLRLTLNHYGLNFDPWAYRFFPTQLPYFLLGALSYRLYVQVKNKSFARVHLNLFYVLFLVITIVYTRWFSTMTEVPYLTLLFIGMPFVFLVSRNWKIDRYIGDLSYIIYISHVFVFSVMKYIGMPITGNAGVLLAVCTIGFSAVIHELITKRIEVIRQNRVKAAAIA